MRPDRQRRGARHGREGRQGKPLKESPRPSGGPPPCFCTLRALVRGFPPFPDFRAELDKVTLAIGKNPNNRSFLWGGVPCPSWLSFEFVLIGFDVVLKLFALSGPHPAPPRIKK